MSRRLEHHERNFLTVIVRDGKRDLARRGSDMAKFEQLYQKSRGSEVEMRETKRMGVNRAR